MRTIAFAERHDGPWVSFVDFRARPGSKSWCAALFEDGMVFVSHAGWRSGVVDSVVVQQFVNALPVALL